MKIETARRITKLVTAYSPPETGRVAAPIKSLERRGRGGHSGLTTPSALSKMASQLFPLRSHTSYPRRGLPFSEPLQNLNESRLVQRDQLGPGLLRIRLVLDRHSVLLRHVGNAPPMQ